MLIAHAPIYLANFKVDFRKSINGLSLLAQSHFDVDIHSRAYFVFINHHRNKVKVLYWDGNGFSLWYKRYEQIRLKVDFEKDKAKQILNADQFQWLLSGLDYENIHSSPQNKYDISH